ncbi:MAG: ABC transporter permease [Spirochaetae bacterium HGW-Spirochaetae-4]|nr:MAG: ABC transporter permease [Spirochaetae bacterium HGW-Spirochaetae-4]
MQRILQTLLLNLFMVLLMLVILLPFYWLIVNSFKTNHELFLDSLTLPKSFQFKNYVDAWVQGLSQYYKNSLIVSTISMTFIIFFSSLTAYGISRFRFRGKTLVFLLILGGMMFSEQIALVPLFKMLTRLQIYNTYFALILPYVAFRIPFSTFLIRAYMLSIPSDLEDAAYIDGYNSWQVFRRIILPLSKPILASCALVNLNFVWNEFVFALVFIEDAKLMTIPIGLMAFKGQLRINYVVMLAGIIIATIPLIIVFSFLQKQFLRGLTSGAVKG